MSYKNLGNFMKINTIACHSLEEYGHVQVGAIAFRGPYHSALNVDLRYYRLSSLLFLF